MAKKIWEKVLSSKQKKSLQNETVGEICEYVSLWIDLKPVIQNWHNVFEMHAS